jgi:hypothetical protein
MKLPVFRATIHTFGLLFTNIYSFMLVPALGIFSALSAVEYLFRASGSNLETFHREAIRAFETIAIASATGRPVDTPVVYTEWFAIEVAIYLIGGAMIAAAGFRYILKKETGNAFRFRFAGDEIRILLRWLAVAACLIVVFGVSMFGTAVLDGLAAGWSHESASDRLNSELGFSLLVAASFTIYTSLAAPAAIANNTLGIAKSLDLAGGNFWRLVLFWILVVVPLVILFHLIDAFAYGIGLSDNELVVAQKTVLAGPERDTVVFFVRFLLFSAFTMAGSGSAYLHLTEQQQ